MITNEELEYEIQKIRDAMEEGFREIEGRITSLEYIIEALEERFRSPMEEATDLRSVK